MAAAAGPDDGGAVGGDLHGTERDGSGGRAGGRLAVPHSVLQSRHPVLSRSGTGNTSYRGLNDRIGMTGRLLPVYGQ